MKTLNLYGALALGVSALALAPGPSALHGQLFDASDVQNNRAIAASPRGKEVAPWLTRGPSPFNADGAMNAQGAKHNTALSEAQRNQAWSSSPRMIEQFPELARSTPVMQPPFTIAPLVEPNSAVRSSPRILEEYPALSRGADVHTGKGGASRLIHPGR